MAKSPEEMLESMVANLREKTGRSLSEWIGVVRAGGLSKHGQIVKMLKTDHGMTHGYANLVAHESLRTASSPSDAAPADPADALYAGPKSALRPIHDALLAAVRSFGPDVELAPKKTYVSLRRSRQFALIQPSTKTRVDVGIQLKGTPPTSRLEASGSFNQMVSHRVRVTKPGEVDAALIGWLRKAYESA